MSRYIDFANGDALRTFRSAARLTQKALAAAAGIHPNSVKYAERQKRPLRGYASSKMRLALNAFGLSIEAKEIRFVTPPDFIEQLTNEWVERRVRQIAARPVKLPAWPAILLPRPVIITRCRC